MLLLDDDDELPKVPHPSEAELSLQLGELGLRTIDTALMSHARRSWLKVARVAFDALNSGGFEIAEDIVNVHVRRIGELVRLGELEAQGNLRRPRFSEVRLPQA
jgi:hypothetical protein